MNTNSALAAALCERVGTGWLDALRWTLAELDAYAHMDDCKLRTATELCYSGVIGWVDISEDDCLSQALRILEEIPFEEFLKEVKCHS